MYNNLTVANSFNNVVDKSAFTQLEAEIFVKSLLEDILPNGKAELASNFYTDDVIGHYNNSKKVFGLEDLKARILAIKANKKECKFVAQHILLVDHIIIK